MQYWESRRQADVWFCAIKHALIDGDGFCAATCELRHLGCQPCRSDARHLTAMGCRPCE